MVFRDLSLQGQGSQRKDARERMRPCVLGSAALVALFLLGCCDARKAAPAKTVEVYRIWESMKEPANIVVPRPNPKGNIQDFLDLIESKVKNVFLPNLVFNISRENIRIDVQAQSNHRDTLRRSMHKTQARVSDARSLKLTVIHFSSFQPETRSFCLPNTKLTNLRCFRAVCILSKSSGV
jgi:hypothetical protein